jgi:ribonucleoside-diphosphate reductase alpha chain
VLEERYLRRDKNGNVNESPLEMFHRVAKHVAVAEKKYGGLAFFNKWQERFFLAMKNFHFMPNSPVLMNAGTTEGQLCACFVLPIENDWEKVYRTLYHTARIHRSGGGTGFNFSDVFSNEDEETLHPLRVMELFNSLTENIKQSGKRRGANMGVLNDDHPAIFEFVSCKADDFSFRNFNISVAVSDAFMTAVMNDSAWELRDPQSGIAVKKIRARDLWDKIILQAWNTGDPGLIFIDAINKMNPVPSLGKIRSTNPCGEVPLMNYEPCVLGSVNLAEMIKKNDGKFYPDYELLAETIQTGIRFLDNVIEVNDFLIPEINRIANANRKIGLGVMGWAEMLIKMDIPYASEKALKLAAQLMDFIKYEAEKVSAALAGERGNFPNYERSIFAGSGIKRRNATLLSIAPTGTISIIAGSSPSIEPLFALSLTRKNILSGKVITEINPVVIDYLKKKEVYTEEIHDLVKRQGSVINATGIEKKIKTVLATALETGYRWHIEHQAIFQQYTDNAVSKTINLHNDATREDIEKAYFIAWEKNCKGITVYRNGSKRTQVMYSGVEIDESNACKICVG